MRQGFAHEAVLVMAPDADVRAPGAAVTVALCGHWEHDPPCPLAPHHTDADRVGDQVELKILFVAAPDAEDTVRRRIDEALAGGCLAGPDGVTTRWRLRVSRRREPAPAEQDHLERLARGGAAEPESGADAGRGR